MIYVVSHRNVNRPEGQKWFVWYWAPPWRIIKNSPLWRGGSCEAWDGVVFFCLVFFGFTRWNWQSHQRSWIPLGKQRKWRGKKETAGLIWKPCWTLYSFKDISTTVDMTIFSVTSVFSVARKTPVFAPIWSYALARRETVFFAELLSTASHGPLC